MSHYTISFVCQAVPPLDHGILMVPFRRVIDLIKDTKKVQMHCGARSLCLRLYLPVADLDAKPPDELLRALPQVCVSYAPAVSLQLRAIPVVGLACLARCHARSRLSSPSLCGLLGFVQAVLSHMVTACNNSSCPCCSCSVLRLDESF